MAIHYSIVLLILPLFWPHGYTIDTCELSAFHHTPLVLDQKFLRTSSYLMSADTSFTILGCRNPKVVVGVRLITGAIHVFEGRIFTLPPQHLHADIGHF